MPWRTPEAAGWPRRPAIETPQQRRSSVGRRSLPFCLWCGAYLRLGARSVPGSLATETSAKYGSSAMDAASFQVRRSATRDAVQAVAQSVQQALTLIRSPTLGLVFLCGNAARSAQKVADALIDVIPLDVPVVVATGAGVLSDAGEVEGGTAAAGLLIGGGRPSVSYSAEHPVTSDVIARHLGPARPRAASLLFLRSEEFQSDELWQARSHGPRPFVFGGATSGDPGLIVALEGKSHPSSIAAVHLQGLSTPTIRTFHSCRLLQPMMKVTRSEGSMVLELDGEPALDRLREATKGVEGQPLIFTLLAATRNEEMPEMLLRGIQGVDPDRGGLLVGKEVETGQHLTFGLREAAAARHHVEAGCRLVRREIAGAAPRFLLYFNGSARGSGLYGTPGVDTRLIREAFPKVPFAGFQSTFEIAPFSDGPAMQLSTGVLGAFCSLS